MSKKSLKDSLQLNKPRRTPNHPTKSHVVKINDNGTESLIRFGQQGVSTAGKPKKGESKKQKARRKSFKARHAKNIAKGKTSAAYWANKVKWNEGGRVLGVTGDDPLSEAMGDRLVTQQRGALADLNDDGYIDIIDAYEFLRPSYPTEIAGALKQAGSNISQGDIAKGMAMAGLGTLMAADYIPGAKFATSTIGRPIKSFLQEVGQKLPDTSVLEAASYKGRLDDTLGSIEQKTLTPEQVEAELKGKVSPTEKQFIQPELEDVRYQAKLQEMAGEKPNQTVTTEYLQKALRRRMPKSGAIREETLEYDDSGIVPVYYRDQRRPSIVSPDYDPIVSDEYKEILVGLTPEMAVQYQKENIRSQGGNYFRLRNPHFEGYEDTIFHIRSDRFRDNAVPGQKGMEEPKNVTFAEEMQSDTAIAKTRYGEFDVNTKIDLNSPEYDAEKEQVERFITDNLIRNPELKETYQILSGGQLGDISAVRDAIYENIQRAFRELGDEKITLSNKSKLRNKIDEEIQEITDDISLARKFIPKYKMEGDFTKLLDTQKKLAGLRYERDRLDIKMRLLDRIDTPKGVPKNFPFLKEWPQLAMQRLINEGVDNADDAIGWISGNQAASVRDRVKHIESFRYSPAEGRIEYYDPVKQEEIIDEMPQFNLEHGEVKWLRENYGNEVADAYNNSPNYGTDAEFGFAFDKPVIKDSFDEKGRNTSKGLRQLYDTVMVKEAKKIGKKYGVEPYQTPNGDWRMDITDKMREDFLTDVTYAEGGSVELDLGMDERDFQREVTKQRSNLADYNNDGRIDSLDALLLGYDIVVPTDPRDITSDAIDALKNIQASQYMPALALGTAALLGTSEYVPVAGQMLKGVTRHLRKALKQYDANIVESRAEEIVKGAESRGGKGPRDVGDTGKDDYSRLTKEELDPLNYQATKMDKPPSEVDVESESVVELAPKKTISIEDLEGKIAIPFYGDRSSLGEKITAVDDIKLETPVLTEGGRDYMRGDAGKIGENKRLPNNPETNIWASGQTIIARLKNRALEEAKETGKEVVGITGTMSPRALDFNNFTPELLAEMTAVTITRGGMKKKDMKAFDDLMRKQVGEDKDFRPVEDWPGIDSPDLRDYIAKAPSRVRKKFMRIMEKQPAQKAGFPSPGKARVATTDRSQLDSPAGMFGGAIGEIDLEADIITDPLIPHSTYDTQMAGKYLGALERDVPQSQLFQDLYKEREGKMVRGKPESEANKSATIRTQVPGQEITPEIVDTISASIEEMKKRGYQEGGRVPGKLGNYIFDKPIEQELMEMSGDQMEDEAMPYEQRSFFDNLFSNFLGAQAIGALELQSIRNLMPIQYWDGEKITIKEVNRDQIQGFAQLGLVKQINDNLIIDGSASLQGGAGRILDNPFQGAIGAGPIEGGITYQTDQGDVRLEGRYDPNSEEKFVGIEGKLRFAKGGVYNAKKVDMMADQILEAYDV